MKKFIKAVYIIVWMSAASVLAAAAGAYFYVEQMPVCGSLENAPRAETGLLLGTAKYIVGGGVNPYYKYRIAAAAKLYAAGKIRRIIASGDSSDKYYNEPKMMIADLVAAGVPESAIIPDYGGERTLDSVVRCRDVFSTKSPLIISQGYHAKRALFLAKSLGMEGASAFAAESPHGLSYTVPNTIREAFARARAVCDVLCEAK